MSVLLAGLTCAPALSKGKRLMLDFEDDDDDSIEVQMPRAGEVLGALKFCEENKK